MAVYGEVPSSNIGLELVGGRGDVGSRAIYAGLRIRVGPGYYYMSGNQDGATHVRIKSC